MLPIVVHLLFPLVKQFHFFFSRNSQIILFQPKNSTFKFPDGLEASETKEDLKKSAQPLKDATNRFKHSSGVATGRRGVPTFFGL